MKPNHTIYLHGAFSSHSSDTRFPIFKLLHINGEIIISVTRLTSLTVFNLQSVNVKKTLSIDRNLSAAFCFIFCGNLALTKVICLLEQKNATIEY